MLYYASTFIVTHTHTDSALTIVMIAHIRHYCELIAYLLSSVDVDHSISSSFPKCFPEVQLAGGSVAGFFFSTQ